MFDLATMKLFFAMLAAATNIVVVGYVVLLVAARFSTGAAARLDQFYDALSGREMLYGALVSGTAMLGSLYMSEIANLPPCRMCWWQRFAMYPIAVVLAVAAWRRYERVRVPVSIAAVVGAAIAGYHYLIQWFPSLEGNSCSITVPCTTAWFQVFGFISIPYMALSAFAFVFVMMLGLRHNQRTTAV
jgi:disulfide bond formation protein DsbB